MAISTVVQRGRQAYIYDEKNQANYAIQIGGGKLCGFSSSIVCVLKGTTLFVFNEKAQVISTIQIGDGEFHSCVGTINIKRGCQIFMYDEKGHCTGTKNA